MHVQEHFAIDDMEAHPYVQAAPKDPACDGSFPEVAGGVMSLEIHAEDVHVNVFTGDSGYWVQMIYLPNGAQGVSGIWKSQLKAKEQALANLRENLGG
jgi:hypothetical protein